MPECNEIVSMLSGYLDRDLPPETCVAIGRHLETCAACGATAEGLGSTINLCRQYRMDNTPGPLPSDKHEKLRQAFRKALSEIEKPRL